VGAGETALSASLSLLLIAGCTGPAVVITDEHERHRPRNATFCELMKHGLAIDVLACPCGHRMKYVATILDRKGLARLLRAKGLPHQLEPILPTRGPPQRDFDFGP